jgi:hypothetical protein
VQLHNPQSIKNQHLFPVVVVALLPFSSESEIGLLVFIGRNENYANITLLESNEMARRDLLFTQPNTSSLHQQFR